MKHILNQCPVIAILRNLPEDLLIPYAESILRGGISVFEVAMNTPDGAGQILALKPANKSQVLFSRFLKLFVNLFLCTIRRPALYPAYTKS